MYERPQRVTIPEPSTPKPLSNRVYTPTPVGGPHRLALVTLGAAPPQGLPHRPVLQAARGRLIRDVGHEIYLYDPSIDESFSLASDAELQKAQLGDWVGYRVVDGGYAEITDWPNMSRVSAIILEAAAELGIKDSTLLSLLIDFSAQNIRTAGSSRGLIKKYLKDWKQFTACYSTADSLFQLLMIGQTTENPGNSITTTRDALIAGVRGSVSHGAIFRIRCGIHGFVIMVRGGGNVELLQSFAGESGEMLATSLQADKSWGLEAMVTLLTDMVSDVKLTRETAQNTLFGGTITDVWPPLEYTWKMARIKSPDEIAEAVAVKLEANLAELKRQMR